MSAIDLDGLYAALAALPDRTPEQRRAYRVARSTRRRAWERQTVVPFRAGRAHWSRFQRRNAAGRFA